MNILDNTVTMATLVSTRLSGRSFVLVMGHDSGNEDEGEHIGDFTLAPRDDLPCWGELRKYQYSHGEDCTQPDDYRPTDLYQPFPAGIPEALCVSLHQFGGKIWVDGDYKDVDPLGMVKMLEELIDDSPWMPELKKSKVYIDDGVLVFKANHRGSGLEFDPTVLVSFLAFLAQSLRLQHLYFSFREHLSVRETCLLMMSQLESPSRNVSWENDYYFANRSVRRVLDADPRMLSGGTFGSRQDYSRQELQEVFSVDDLPDAFIVCNLSFPDKEIPAFCEKFKEYVAEAYKKETEKSKMEKAA